MKLHTARLQLVPATLKLICADLHRRPRLSCLLNAEVPKGWPSPLFDVAAMQHLKQALTAESVNPWSALYCLLRRPRTLIGMAGFKSKPRDGAVEIGYGLLPQFHRRGLGTELVGAMARWAFANGVNVVFAETLPELIASQRVLLKNQFSFVGEGSEPGVMRFERCRS